MLQILVKICGKLLLLIFVFLFISHPVSALHKSATEAGRAEQPAAISDIGGQATAQATAQDAHAAKSKQSSFVSTEIEPLLLLLFGLFLFSVATGVKVKLLKR